MQGGAQKSRSMARGAAQKLDETTAALPVASSNNQLRGTGVRQLTNVRCGRGPGADRAGGDQVHLRPVRRAGTGCCCRRRRRPLVLPLLVLLLLLPAPTLLTPLPTLVALVLLLLLALTLLLCCCCSTEPDWQAGRDPLPRLRLPHPVQDADEAGGAGRRAVRSRAAVQCTWRPVISTVCSSHRRPRNGEERASSRRLRRRRKAAGQAALGLLLKLNPIQ